ncbi:response regulator transcription factor [Botrimarina hoheduenensis]|nr:LuxR C-terminal-related transcriptional regulator [Botrimarina hoheduenensis]
MYSETPLNNTLPPATPATVCVIDADPSDRDRIVGLATQLGHQSRAFSNFDEYFAAGLTPSLGCLVFDASQSSAEAPQHLKLFKSRNATIPVIALVNPSSVSEVLRLLESGATSALEKPVANDSLSQVIARAIDDCRRRHALRERYRGLLAQVSQLSDREHQVLQQIAAGHLNKVIAGSLEVSVRTVESDRARVVEKLGSQTTGEAVAKYAQYQVLTDLGFDADSTTEGPIGSC